MPNDFEKRVRQKMDELDFVPGEPVWLKIEEQIKKKKEKRRVIFWVPFLVLLLGGTVYWLNQKSSNVDSSNNKSSASVPVSREENNSTATKETFNNVPVKEVESGNSKKEENGITNLSVSTFTTNTIVATPVSQVKKAAVKNAIVDRKSNQRSGSHSTSELSSDPSAADEKKEDKKAMMIPVSPVEKKAEAIVESPGKNPVTTVEPLSKSDSAKPEADSNVVVVKTEVTKSKQNSNWRFGIVASGGVSGMADGLTVLSQEKMMADALTNLGSGFPTSPAVAPPQATTSITNGFSFSIGASAVKKLWEKFRFSAGLGYHYFSNKMQVGSDSAGYIRAYAPNYQNQAGPNSYTNHYHFISLPVDLAYQPLKKLPLSISAGLSVQQLLATDALVYSRTHSAYIQNKDAFTQTQFFSRFGLDYTFSLKKYQLSVGPQLNYGLSNLMKNDHEKQLFSFGLRSAFLF